MSPHVFLVAFTVEAADRESAEAHLLWRLPRPHDYAVPNTHIEEWWIAEDDRHDGSDNDSAIFVPPGSQECVSTFLVEHGATPAHNLVSRDSIFECPHGGHEGATS